MKNLRLLYLICGAFLFAKYPAPAQELCKQLWQGEVVDAATGEKLPQAVLLSLSSKRRATTDHKGRFTLEIPCDTDTSWQIRYVGYQPKLLQLKQALPERIGLKKVDFLLEEVEVAAKIPDPLAGLAVDALSGTALAQAPGISLGEKLRALNGVTTLQTGPTIFKPVIHGLHSNRILILNNGVRQEGQQWGLEHAPEIDAFAAKRISVVKGAATVRYGADALGGVVLVAPEALPTEGGLSGQVHLIGHTNGRGGIASAQLQGSAPWKGAGWRLQGTLRKAGDAHAPNYTLSNTGVREANFSGAFGIHRQKQGIELSFSHFSTSLGILSSAHIGNLSDLQAAFERERPFRVAPFSYQIDQPRQQVQHSLAKLQGYYQLSERSKLSTVLASQWNQRQEFDRRRGNRSNIPALDMLLHSHTLETLLENVHNERWHSTLGLTGMFQQNTNIPGTGVNPLVPNFNTASTGLFAFGGYTHKRLELEAGFRYDYRHLQVFRFDRQGALVRPEFNFHNLSMNLGMVWQAGKEWSYRSNLGTAWRPPHVQELFSQGLHHGVAALEIGNEHLRTERALKWVHTLAYETDRLSIALSPYINFIQDFIFLEPQAEPALTIRGAFPVFHFTQTDARLIGLDFSLSYQMYENWEYIGKFSAIRARDLRQRDFLIFMPADQLSQNLRFSLTDKGKRSNTFIGLQSLWVAEQFRVPEGLDFAPPPAGYMLWGLQCGSQWQVGQSKQLQLLAGADNLFNQTYRDYMNRFRYFADDTGRNVYLQLTYRFGS